MKKTLIKGLLGAVLLALIFIFATPISFYFDCQGHVAFFESMVIAVILLVVYFKIHRVKHPKRDDVPADKFGPDKWPYIYALISWVVLGATIYFAQEHRLVSKLKEEGLYTFGRVTDGEHSSTRRRRGGRTDTYKISLVYYDTITKTKFTPSTEISEDEYNNLEIDQNIQLVYLKSNPKVFKLILSKEELTRYLYIKPRSLNIDDINYLIKSLSPNANVGYLNKISHGWSHRMEDSALVFENDFENEHVAFSKDGMVVYQGNNLELITKKLTPIPNEYEEEEDSDEPTKTIAMYSYKEWTVLERSKLVMINDELATRYYLLFYPTED